jgi:coatomer subunit epsilon
LDLPDSDSSDYVPTLLYQARAHIALNDPDAALAILPKDTENVAFKAATALAKYVAATSTTDKEASLDALRDLSLEVDGDDVEGTEKEKAMVRVLAGTAFTIAGEVEEALETLGSDTEDLDA